MSSTAGSAGRRRRSPTLVPSRGSRGARRRSARRLELLRGAVDLFGEVAGDLVAGLEDPQRRILRRADLRVAQPLAQPAPRVEPAARWRRRGRWHVASKDDPPPARLDRRIRDRDRREQRDRVGVERERGSGRATLASSTIRPRYITAIRSLMWRTTDRSWAMNRYVRSNSPWSRSSRLMIWAWIETSRALIGSSATIRSGFSASARATPIRCRCPPENSCG